jgi:hypothetical protein
VREEPPADRPSPAALTSNDSRRERAGPRRETTGFEVRDPDDIVRNLEIIEHPGSFVYMSVPDPDPALADQAAAVVREPEGVTYVVPADAPVLASPPTGSAQGPAMAWLTIAAHTSLEGVGLTARLAAALAERDVPCNVVAGFFHDHLLVPADRREAAIEVLVALRG